MWRWCVYHVADEVTKLLAAKADATAVSDIARRKADRTEMKEVREGTGSCVERVVFDVRL